MENQPAERLCENMRLTDWVIKNVVGKISSQKQLDLLMGTLVRVGKGLSGEQRIRLFRNLAENHLHDILGDMSHEERVSLMNSLLPLIVREFPLDELDFASAFPILDDAAEENDN